MTHEPSRRARPGNPYQDLPPQNFWRTAVAEHGLFGVQELHQAKFRISPQDCIITAGSCFAQHVSTALSGSGYNWLDAEPAPDRLFHPHNHLRLSPEGNRWVAERVLAELDASGLTPLETR